MPNINSCHNTADFREAARRRLPAPLYHYIDGGADDEYTKENNVAAYSNIEFVPRCLQDMRSIDTSSRLFGRELAFPIILAPIAMNRLFHDAGESAVATEAGKLGIGYSLSTMATTSVEDIARATPGAKLFQLYLLSDDAMNFAVIDRCRKSGFDALCLTVDTVVPGNRERDLRTGMTVPPRLSPRSFLDFLARPRWCLDYVSSKAMELPNVTSDSKPGAGNVASLAGFFASVMDRNLTWERAERLVRYWGGPFAIKGILTAEDARRARDIGATAVIISNHGGRQLDYARAPIDSLPEIAAAVGGEVELIVDGGIRRGNQVAKALAMGASGCMIGRPYIYGLSGFGQPGVRKVLQLLCKEFERTLALLGCSSVAELGPHLVTRRVQSPSTRS